VCGGALHAGGGAFADWDLLRRTLIAGCDPAHPHHWGEARDGSQPCVELGAMGFACALAGEALIAPLPAAARARALAWLAGINAVKLVDNNWLYFRVLANLGLRSVGADWSPSAVAADLARLGQFYRGGGWYTDGPGRARDHYIGWAMHFYGLIYAVHQADVDPDGAAVLRERARLFARDYPAWFDGEGAALALGRSLTYRFAQGAFWGALAYAGVEAWPWGVIKGLWLRHLRWWWRRAILDPVGRLTVGYGYPQPQMAERYNCAASPYWALKAFLPLALPEAHPFWQAAEAPHPAGATDSIEPQPHAGLVLCRDASRDHVFALNNNAGAADSWLRHSAHKYAKFAYSTRFAFAVAAGNPVPAQLGVDSTLALSDDGRDWRLRDRVEELPCGFPAGGAALLRSRWSPWPEVVVTTWLVPLLPGHVRVHHVRSPRPLRALEGGFAVDGHGMRSGSPAAAVAVARNPGAASGIRCLRGARTARVLGLEPGTHLLFPLASAPVAEGDLAPGDTWLATAVCARPAAIDDRSVEDWLASLSWQTDGVRWTLRREGSEEVAVAAEGGA
jgi:hypothetical protein